MNCKLKFTIFLFLPILAHSQIPSKQEVLDKFGFEEHRIVDDSDTIEFYIHQAQDKKPDNLVLYLQGSAPDPLFNIEKENGTYQSYRWFPGDYKLLDDNYAYVIIAKTGIPGVFEIDTKRNVSKYQEVNSLDNRVERADAVIKYITTTMMPELDKIIVYGHSEGAPVAAKLGTLNDKITHLGFWAGNALPDFYDFVLFNFKAIYEGRQTYEQGLANLDTLIANFNHIADNPDEVKYDGYDDYTNLRWWSYAEPPINNLLKINIPLFVQVAGKDESAPIESTFLIPLEFARMKKNNLTFRVCTKCDHGFQIENENGQYTDKWPEIFEAFISWTE